MRRSKWDAWPASRPWPASTSPSSPRSTATGSLALAQLEFIDRHEVVHFLGQPTPDPDTGIGEWEKDDIVELLRTGTTPEQSKVKGAMRETIEDGLKYLSDSDLEAIADYLFAQSPIVHNVTRKR